MSEYLDPRKMSCVKDERSVVTEIRCMTTKNEQFSEDGIWKSTQKNKRKNATIDSALVNDDEQ